MALCISSYTIIKVIQATHHQGDNRCGATRGIKSSCMSLISGSWTLFKSLGLWDKFDFYCKLDKGLFEFIGRFTYFGTKYISQ